MHKKAHPSCQEFSIAWGNLAERREGHEHAGALLKARHQHLHKLLRLWPVLEAVLQAAKQLIRTSFP